MADEKLSIDITADAKDAIKSIDDVQKRVDKLEKTDAEVEVTADTDGATKDISSFTKKLEGLSARDQIITLALKAGQAQTELNDLRTEVSQLDATDPSIDVKLARLAEVSGDLDELEGKIKEIGDANPEIRIEIAEQSRRQVQGVTDDLENMRQKGEGFQSALPALRGFSDEMGGLSQASGIAGQALGDLGDFSAILGEKFGLSEKATASLGAALGGVGLAIVGVGLAVQLGQKAWQAYNRQSDETAKKTAATSKALRDVTDDVTDLGKALEENAKGGTFLDKLTLALSKSTDDFDKAAASANRLGIGVENIGDALATMQASKDSKLGLFEQLLQRNIPGLADEAAAQIAKMIAQGDNFREIWNLTSTTYGKDATKILDANKGIIDDIERLDDLSENNNLDKIAKDFLTGVEATEGGVQKVMDARDRLAQKGIVDPTNLQMATELASGLDDAAASALKAKVAFQGTADQLGKWADQTAQAITGMDAYDKAVRSTDWGASSLDSAVTAMSKFTEQHNALIDINADTEEAFDSLRDSVKENGKTFDVTTDKGRANQKALEDVARTLDTKLAAAYVDANGDMDTFKTKASAIATETLTRLQKELGLSDDQTAALATSLGLLPSDIETRYKLSGDEEAKAKLQLLQTAIDNLPADVQTQVTQKIIVGDYQGALAVVQGYYNRNPADIKTEAQEPGNLALIGAAIGAYYQKNPVPVATKASGPPAPTRQRHGGTTPRDGGIAGEAGPEYAVHPDGRVELLTTPTYVAPGTKVTSVARTRRMLAARPRRRIASTRVSLDTSGVEQALDRLARTRTATITARVLETDQARWYRLNGRS